jgi:hypothetical protein
MLAAAMEWNFRLVNLALVPYRELFREFRRGPLGAWPPSPWPCPYPGRLLRFVRKPLAGWARRFPGCPFGWHYPQEWMDLSTAALPGAIGPFAWNVFWGDRFGSDLLVRRHAEKIRSFFGLTPLFCEWADAWLGPPRAGAAKVVVVHVRQGDFATWADGSHYFTDVQYADRMRKIQSALAPQPVKFEICCQHSPDLSAFGGLPVRHRIRDLKQDFALIQRADVCLATISSFARTACFLGQVPWVGMSAPGDPLPSPADWRVPETVS